MRPLLVYLSIALASAQTARQPVKPVPPPGIEVPAADRVQLQQGLERLRSATAQLAGSPLLPDVLIYQQAVRYALAYNEFFKADEIAKAKALLKEGEERARMLLAGE